MTHPPADQPPPSPASRPIPLPSDVPREADLETLKAALAPSYDVQGELGSGAMAMVYRAVDRKHQRAVAIKVLRPEHAAVHGAERFVQEIGLTARLSHPHILPLLDSGFALGLPYYVMPVVEGVSLRDLLDRQQRLPLHDALRLAGQIAEALAYAHAQGVLHRDIKPGNILISGRHALVADFGIAKAVQAAADTYQTHVGQVVGTPAYMSPEQASGDELDGRSDVYSLAAVLFEMLAGEAAWAGDSLRVIMTRRFVEAPPSVHARRPEIPPVVDGVLQRGLAREPNERYASAAEFADALAALQISIATTASQITVPPRTVQPVASIAVLPFENLSADPENAFLSDGITEDILTSLARLPGVRVSARSSCFALKGQAVDARTACERLGVRNLVTGSVRRAGNRLRVSAELVDVSDGFPRWSERYDRTVEDVFAIQDDISGAIVRALNIQLGDKRAVSGAGANSTGVVAAYEAVLRGRELLNRRTESTTQQAIGAFQRAADLDPRFATAYAGLADSWAMLAVYGSRSPNEAMPEAARRAEQALALSPELAEPRAALALVQGAFHWDWSAAEASFKRAIAASPSYATAHQWYATTVHVPQARFDEAIESTMRAMRLDPLSLACKATLSAVLFYAQRYHEAIDAANHALSLDSTFAPAYFFLAQALAHLDDRDAAIDACERVCQLSDRSSESLAMLGYLYGKRGDSASADKVFAELQQRSEARYVSPSHLALVNLGSNRVGPALDDLSRAVQARASDLIWLGARPAWRPLHGYQRFRDILSRIGVSAAA